MRFLLCAMGDTVTIRDTAVSQRGGVPGVSLVRETEKSTNTDIILERETLGSKGKQSRVME